MDKLIKKTKNQFKEWFYNLTVQENRRAKQELIERYELSASTFYYWLGNSFHFSKLCFQPTAEPL